MAGCPVCEHVAHLEHPCAVCGPACGYERTMAAAGERLRLALSGMGMSVRQAVANLRRNLGLTPPEPLRCPGCQCAILERPGTEVIRPVAVGDDVIVDCGACGWRSSWPAVSQ